jgi:protein SCO1/2
MTFRLRPLALAPLALLLALAAPAAAQTQAEEIPLPESGADRTEALPEELEGVGIQPPPDAAVPRGLRFRDEEARPVGLEEYLGRDRPVLLALVYYQCPMLCNLLLNGVVDAMRDMDLEPGRDFELVAVSINPLETPGLAKLKKQAYLTDYGRPESAPGWHLLTGNEQNIKALADSVGFRYNYVDDTGEYAHGAGVFVLTPEGRLSRFLAGVMFESRTMRLALLEASEGKIGSALDQFVLFCFHYDETTGRYAPAARRIMQAGGALTVLVIGAMLLTFWLRETRRRRKAETGSR